MLLALRQCKSTSSFWHTKKQKKNNNNRKGQSTFCPLIIQQKKRRKLLITDWAYSKTVPRVFSTRSIPFYHPERIHSKFVIFLQDRTQANKGQKACVWVYPGIQKQGKGKRHGIVSTLPFLMYIHYVPDSGAGRERERVRASGNGVSEGPGFVTYRAWRVNKAALGGFLLPSLCLSTSTSSFPFCLSSSCLPHVLLLLLPNSIPANEGRQVNRASGNSASLTLDR